MRAPAKKALTWLLAGLFAILCAGGEWLHFIPGSGHAIPVPGGLLYLGLAKPAPAAFMGCGGPITRANADEGVLILDEDECAVCSLVAQGQARGLAVDFQTTLPLLEYLPAIVIRSFSGCAGQCYHARAPPLS